MRDMCDRKAHKEGIRVTEEQREDFKDKKKPRESIRHR